MRYKEVKYAEEWARGQHDGHTSRQVENWLYCDDCRLKFRTGLAPAQIERALQNLHRRKEDKVNGRQDQGEKGKRLSKRV